MLLVVLNCLFFQEMVYKTSQTISYDLCRQLFCLKPTDAKVTHLTRLCLFIKNFTKSIPFTSGCH